MRLSKQEQEYLAHRCQTGSALELIRMLYEAALRSVGEAVQAVRSGDILARGQAVTKTIEILSELQSSLRHDVNAEYSSTLAGLYSYMQGQLIRAHAEQSEELLNEVSRLFQTLLEGWVGAMDKLKASDGQADPPTPLAAEAASEESNGNNPYSDPVGSSGRGRSWQV